MSNSLIVHLQSPEWLMAKRILGGICVLITVLFLIFPFIGTQAYKPASLDIYLNDGWKVMAEGEIENVGAKLPYIVKMREAKNIDIYKVIPELPYSAAAIQFPVQRKNVRVYVDDALIYEKRNNISWSNGKTPGNGTVLANLPENSSGKMLRISYERLLETDKGPLCEVALIDSSLTPQNYVNENIFVFSLMVSLIFLGVVLLILLLFYRKVGVALMPFFFLAIAILTIACWSLCKTTMIELFVSNWSLSYNIEHISFFFLPYVVLSFIRYNWKNPTTTLDVTSDMLLVLFTATLLISFFFRIDFLVFLSPSHVFMGLATVVIFREAIVRYTREVRSFRILCVGIGVLCVTVIGELVNYYMFASIQAADYIFIYGFTIFSVVLLISFVSSVNERLDQVAENQNKINIDAEHTRYEKLLSNTSDIFVDWDIAKDGIYFSKQFEEYFGEPPYIENVLENSVKTQNSVTYSIEPREIYKRILNGSSGENVVGTFVSKDGEHKWFEISLATIYGADNRPVRAIGILRDISREKLLEEEFINQMEQLKINKEIFVNVLEADITEDRVVGKNSEQLALSLGVVDRSFTGIINAITNRLTHEDFIEGYSEMFSRDRILSLYKKNIGFFEYECREKLEDGEYHWIRVHVRIFKSSISRTIKIISYVRDIEEEKQKEMALLSSSQTDSLTGLLHKGATELSIKEYLAGEGAHGTHALLMIDLDYFKNVNDTLGHLAGDQVVEQVARRLEERFGDNSIIGRIGGDEFMVLLKDIVSTASVSEVCEGTCKLFHGTYAWEGKSCGVSVSIGVSIYPTYGDDYETLYKNVDVALYCSKSRGRNTYTVYASS